MPGKVDCSAYGSRYALAVVEHALTLTPTPTAMVRVGVRVSPNVASAYLPLHALHSVLWCKNSAMIACLANLLCRNKKSLHLSAIIPGFINLMKSNPKPAIQVSNSVPYAAGKTAATTYGMCMGCISTI